MGFLPIPVESVRARHEQLWNERGCCSGAVDPVSAFIPRLETENEIVPTCCTGALVPSWNAFSPILPVPVDESPEGCQREPRQWQYPVC